jgi:hypothetical protein
MSGSGQGQLPDDFLDLVDLYCSGLIDQEGFHRLESMLLDSRAARDHFVAYFHHHTEIQFAIRAGRAADAVLERLTPIPSAVKKKEGADSRRWRLGRWHRGSLAAAAGVALVAAGIAAARYSGSMWPIRKVASVIEKPAAGSIAWLVNAQDCRWAGQEQKPSRDMQAGKILRLERGLAEIEFDQGARVILQGPASLELISASAGLLRYGTLTARVPARARGFTVISPGGKIVDLGTEFGLSVNDGGTTTVRVFKGEVEAFPSVFDPVGDHGVTVHQDQTAQIDGRTVALGSSRAGGDDLKYVRAIVPPPLRMPRVLHLDFTHPAPGTILDGDGRGVGLSSRLPGTGTGLPQRDINLKLCPDRRALELTTTRSDLNTQENLSTGEYLGVRLADLGFTGKEDFEISATLPDIPSLKEVGQFGLYAGSRSDTNIRGGLISRSGPGGPATSDFFRLFLVKNNKGVDFDIYEIGLMTTGDNLRLTLRRLEGRFSLVVDNLTRNSSSTLEISQPDFLDPVKDMHVGLFGANTQSEFPKTLTIRDLKVTVWTTQADNPTIIQSGVGR